jgi:hypothetical protein
MRTEIKMRFNLGYLKGEEEIRFKLIYRVYDLEGLWNHLSGLMPDPADFDQSISRITLHTLNDDPCAGDNQDPTTYGMQIGFTIHHEAPLSVEAARDIIDAVYENGANASYTPDSDDTYLYTFIGPYQFHHTAPEEAPVPVPVPVPEDPIHPPIQYNCSPAFASCDGEYPPHPQVVDMCYTCERCGRTITHSIDNPTVCKRCF